MNNDSFILESKSSRDELTSNDVSSATVSPLDRVLVALLVAIPPTSGTLRGGLIPFLKVSDLLLIALLGLVIFTRINRVRLFDGFGAALISYTVYYVSITILNYSQRGGYESTLFANELLHMPQYLCIFLVAFWISQRAAIITVWLVYTFRVTTFVAMIGFAQFINLGPIRRILSEITGNVELLYPVSWKVYRATSFFPSWHALGMYLAMVFVLCIFVLLQKQHDKRLRSNALICAFSTAIGSLVTVTATPIILILLTAVVAVIVRRKLKILVFLGAACLSAYFVPTFRTELETRLLSQANTPSESFLPQTIWFRFIVWTRDYLPIISENFWTGFGPFDEVSLDRVFGHFESMYIALLVLGGLPLLILFVLLLVFLLYRLRYVQQTTSNWIVRCLALSTIFSVLFLLLAQFLHPYLRDVGVTPFFYSLIGIIFGSFSLEKPRVQSSFETGNHSTSLY